MAVMAEAREADRYWDRRGLALLWSAVFLAPAALALNIGVGYAAVKLTCASGNGAILVFIWAAALAMSAAGLALGWRLMGLARPARVDGGSVVDRSYFVAIGATGLNVLAMLLIVTSGAAQLVLDACD
jgi:hypothetical protein